MPERDTPVRFHLINEFSGPSAAKGEINLATVPSEDKSVYEMICRADTTGVFQIESRAQMAMLPPGCAREIYYDLVIICEVGDLCVPARFRPRWCILTCAAAQHEEAVTYPSKAVDSGAQAHPGVPIFQEQVMQLAVVAAGFSPGEADRLRRAMAAWKRKGGLGAFSAPIDRRYAGRGYAESFAQQIFKQILGFGEYGFPEAHAASFALLATHPHG